MDDADLEIGHLLKIILPGVEDKQKLVLLEWLDKRLSYNSAWESFELYNCIDNAILAQEKSSILLDSEDAVNSTITTIFMAAPNPDDANGLWDAGKEKSSRTTRKNAITYLKNIIDEHFKFVKGNAKKLDEYLNKKSEPTDSTITTTMTVVNSLPDTVIVSAKVDDQKAWPSESNRPDQVLPSGSKIEGFCSVSGECDLSNPPESTSYTLTVSFDVPPDTKPEQTPAPLVVSFDQSHVLLPTSSKGDQFEKLGANKWVTVLVGSPRDDGTPGVDFFISPPQED